ncbi:hypothetical protein CF088_06655 [Clostridium botulinum]|nr:putative aBC transporter, ATP-binding protein [Clostridium botulinum]APQ69206.1 putative aBC transporter, ATP-binding protein [Clostridium botulinum]MBN3404982.1 hypothetical protein [Clostridium botulinum]
MNVKNISRKRGKIPILKNIFIKTDLPEKAAEIIKSIPDIELLKVEKNGISVLVNTDICDITKIL